MDIQAYYRRYGNRRNLAIGGGLCLVLMLGIILLGGDDPGEQTEAGLTYEATVEAMTVSINESGSIESRDRVTLKSQVPGQQTIIYLIAEGTMVDEGDLLIEFDSSSFEDDLLEEEIELENAEAELISARENLEVVKNQAKADIAQAELDYEFAQQDLQKYR